MFLLSFYTLSKSLIRIFAPKLFDDSQWVYFDLFLPMFLPTLDVTNGFKPVVASRSFSDYHQSFEEFNNETSNSSVSSRAVYTSTKNPKLNDQFYTELTTKVSQLLFEAFQQNKSKKF